MASPKDCDFLILGGGLAGSVLASRLSEACPTASLIVIEAGQDESNNPLCIAPLGCFGLHHTAVDWNYTTVPQKHLGGRQCYAGAGKALGGSSAINYGVWTRGAKEDYDSWADMLGGDERWSYDGMLDYFRRTERHFDETQEQASAHGFSGPIWTGTVSTSSPRRKYGLREATRNALKGVGLSQIEDGNAGFPTGFWEFTENWREGRRQIASEAYGTKTHSNVTIITGQQVKRIIITAVDGLKAATGAETMDGTVYTARKEVILSCGAYRSPHLLLLSGVGPQEELAKYGIEQHVELPVGLNLHDHLTFQQFWKLSQPQCGLSFGSPIWNNEPAYSLGLPNDWLAWTPAASTEELLAAQQIDEEKASIAIDAPEQLRWARRMISDPTRPRLEMFIPYVPAGGPLQGANLPLDGTYISTIAIGVLPTSRGRISLASSDPSDPPLIDFNYYATEVDRTVLRAGIRLAMRAAVLLQNADGSPALLGETPPPGVASIGLDSSDEAIDERVRICSQNTYHAGGGCPLGTVLDSECKVKGIERLRVVDASIMPAPLSCHYQAVVYAIAEKTAEMIAQTYESG